MPTVHTAFTGDAGGVMAAKAQAQAAIDSLSGKTVYLDVVVRERGGGVRDHAAAMGEHARASERAATAARDHGDAAGRAGSRVREHAAASERAGRAMGGLGDSSDRASGGVERAGRAGRDADRSLGGLGGTSSRVGRGLSGLGDGAGDAALGIGGLLRNTSGLGGALSQTGGVLGSVTSVARTAGMAFAYSAAGSGLLTGAVGALGAVGVASLGGVGVAAGAAGAAMAEFTLDAHKDSARFGASFKQMGQAAHLGAQMVSEPMAGALESLGRSMVSADNTLTPAGARIARNVQAGFGEAANVVTESSDAIMSAAQVGSAGFARLTAEAAPGARSFLSSLPSLTQGAVSGMSQITSEFGRSGAAIEGATPSFNRAMGAAGALGAELISTGRRSMVPFNENVTSMLNSVTGMTSRLGPAIKPSMQAVTDVVGVTAGSLGDLAPDIARFAQTVSANGPALQQGLTGIGRGMLGLGEGAIEGVAAASPSLDRMGQSLSRYGPAAGRATGQAGSILGDIVSGAVEGFGAAQEAGESGWFGSKAGFDRSFGATRDDSGRITGWGRSMSGGPARTTSGYVGGTGLGGIIAPGDDPSVLHALRDMAGWEGSPSAKTAGAAAPASSPTRALAPPPNLAGTALGSFLAPQMSRVAGAGTAAGADVAGALGAIPAGVGQARSALNTLPSVAGTAMGGARSAIAGANIGASMGSQVSRMTQTMESAAPQAASAGAKVGAAMGGGMAQGTTTSMQVVDKVMIQRLKQVEETSMGAIEARSPSRRYKRIGGYIPMGLAEGIAERGRDAMAASGAMFANQSAEADRYRTQMQAAPDIRVAAPAMNADPSARAAGGGLSGDAKRRAFGETPGGAGTRMVFDKQVMSWNADPNAKLGNLSMEQLNKSISSPLTAQQQTAMESMQGAMDAAPGARNFQMFGQRTQQNILRNRAGAFNVAGQIEDFNTRANTGSQKPDIPELQRPVGGSGAGGQSWLGKDRIGAVRQAAGLGSDTAAGFGTGIRNNLGAAVTPMADLAAAQKKRYTDDWGIRSPSTVAAGYSGDIMAGAAAGITGNAGAPVGALGQVNTAMRGYASDAGLQVGYTYGRNIVTGADVALKTANLAAAGTPNLDEPVMAGLGSSRLLGPALGGASVAKTPSVVFDGGSIASAVASAVASRPNVVQVQVDLDGEPFRQYVANAVAEFIAQFRDAT